MDVNSLKLRGVVSNKGGDTMLKYTVKRLFQSLVTVFIIVCAVFFLMRLMPVEGYFGEEFTKLSQEMINRKLETLGLMDPPLVQLFRFLNNLAHGDLGVSLRLQVDVPIIDIIASKAPVSAQLGIISTVIALIIGIVLGVTQAMNKGKIADTLGTAYIIFINSVPALVYYFFIQLFITKWLDLPMRFDMESKVTWILPIVSMAMGGIAGYALWVRRYMVDELNKDYIKLARSKGLPYKYIMYHHVLRNAFVPMVQYLPVSFLMTISGSLLVEELYAIPGMGNLLVMAIQKQDNNLVQAIILIYATIGIVGVFLGDVLMMIIDPRISIDSKGGSR